MWCAVQDSCFCFLTVFGLAGRGGGHCILIYAATLAENGSGVTIAGGIEIYEGSIVASAV